MPKFTHNSETTNRTSSGLAEFQCPTCKSLDPKERFNHWLSFNSEELLEDHVSRWMQFERSTTERKAERVDSICRAYREERASYLSSNPTLAVQGLSDMVDPATGAPLGWRDARRQLFAADRDRIAAAQEAREKAASQRLVPVNDLTPVDVLIRGVLHKMVGAHDPWALAHLEMERAGLSKPGRHQEAAEFCLEMAQRDSRNMQAWVAEANWWCPQAPEPFDDSEVPF